MRDVPSDDESESAHGEGFAVGDAVTRPRGWRQILEQANRGQADKAELHDVLEPGDSMGLGTFRADVLVIAGERRIESSRKPESAKGKGAFGVRDVIEDLANAPFIGGVAVKRRFLRDACEEFEGFGQLLFHHGKGIVPGNHIYVGEIVGCGFGIFRAAKA